MPNWTAVLRELDKNGQALDNVRRKYLKKLHVHTKRNIICYYSGWLQYPGTKGVDITDADKNGFMNAVHKLDRSKGLDLVLHTPGGDVAATESIVDYLFKMFNGDIRAIVPQLAMSAGTMLACSTKSIVMGKQSNIGPFDPHFNGIPAAGIIKEFNRAMSEIKQDPTRVHVWHAIISKYHPTFVGQCENAVNWATKIVKEWLARGMFAEDADATGKAEHVAQSLIDLGASISHSVHVSSEQCQLIGLKIEELEADPILQDLVLTVHHTYMHTFGKAPCIKIIENHLGSAIVNFPRPEQQR